jgi:acyl-CoA thioesterase
MSATNHPFADTLGIEVLDRTDNLCTCQIKFSEKLLNPNGVIHGGVLYSLADTGMGGALHLALDEGEISATIEIKITYFHAAGATDLWCESRVIKKGRKVAMLESEIFADKKLVAKASGSFAVFKPSIQ